MGGLPGRSTRDFRWLNNVNDTGENARAAFEFKYKIHCLTYRTVWTFINYFNWSTYKLYRSYKKQKGSNYIQSFL